LKIRTFIVSLAVACSLGACTAAAPEPEPGPDVTAPGLDVTAPGDEEAAPAAEERIIAPTPEMLDAALFGDPEAMAAVVPLSGCQAPSTCPSQYGSCSGWSNWAQCSLSCNSNPWCGCGPEHPDEPPCEPNPYETSALVTSNRFRVCFNSQGQSCTEWNRGFSSYCGC
jgi:hypothetical protein